jgi:hypothetical protein
MIKRFLPMLIAAALVFSIVTLASARGAPNQKTDAVQAAIVDTPVMTATVPQMTGYDVIQNRSETRALFSAGHFYGRHVGAKRLSPRDWRSHYLSNYSGRPDYHIRSGTSAKR